MFSTAIVTCSSVRPLSLVLISLLIGAPLRAAENLEVTKKDFAFVFQCDEKTKASCLVGKFASGDTVTLVRADGIQCSATTKDSYGYEGANEEIPATRLDASQCQKPDFAFAWLSPKKGMVQVIKPELIEDKAQLTAIARISSRSGLMRFNEKKWREDNPDPDPNDQWPDVFGNQKQQWRAMLDGQRSYYKQFKSAPSAYRIGSLGIDFVMLRYVTYRDRGPLFVQVRGGLHFLAYLTTMPVAFSIGPRNFLKFDWNAGEGGYHGTSIWEIDEKGAHEFVSDSSFST